LLQPIRYFSGASAPRDREVLALGNPVFWWGFLALLPLQAYTLARNRRWQDAVGIGGYLALWAPWLFLGRTKYIYYMVPCVPFMALSCVSAIRGVPGPWAKWVGIGFGTACTVAGLAFLPMWIDLPLPAYTRYLRWLPTWI
jgi:dolichyl-phosphate-mannose--protein O-mannosyl transferase